MRLQTFTVKFLLIISLFVGLNAYLAPSSFAREPIRTVIGTVTKVSDGDSIQITTPKQTKLRVRLYGIDAPETAKINHQSGHINKPGQTHTGKNPGRHWKPKSRGNP
jgi:micrococcal nuclease